MKKVWLVLALSAAVAWIFTVPSARADVAADYLTAQETTFGYGTLPTVASYAPVTDGGTNAYLDLTLINAYKIVVCAPSGETMGSTGTLRAFTLDPRLGLVTRNANRDLTLSTATGTAASACSMDGGSVGCRCVNWDDVPVGYGDGQLMFKPAAVTTSSTNTVTIYYRGYRKRN